MHLLNQHPLTSHIGKHHLFQPESPPRGLHVSFTQHIKFYLTNSLRGVPPLAHTPLPETSLGSEKPILLFQFTSFLFITLGFISFQRSNPKSSHPYYDSQNLANKHAAKKQIFTNKNRNYNRTHLNQNQGSHLKN
jgi:hypothetical protein